MTSGEKKGLLLTLGRYVNGGAIVKYSKPTRKYTPKWNKKRKRGFPVKSKKKPPAKSTKKAGAPVPGPEISAAKSTKKAAVKSKKKSSGEVEKKPPAKSTKKTGAPLPAAEISAAKSTKKSGGADAAAAERRERFFNTPNIVHANFMKKAKKLDARIDRLMKNKKSIDPVRAPTLRMLTQLC